MRAMGEMLYSIRPKMGNELVVTNAVGDNPVLI